MKSFSPLLITLFVIYITNSWAQPGVKWFKNYGGSLDDEAVSMQITFDGGFIMAGQTWSSDMDVTENKGFDDYWIVKTDNNGEIQWQKSLGGPSVDYANYIQQTSDSGYIVAGPSYSSSGDVSQNNGETDYWIVKLDPNGNIQWEKSFGGPIDDRAQSISQTSDGGYIVAGWTGLHVSGGWEDQDCWIVRLDPIGNVIWEKTYGGSLNDRAFCITQTSDGGYIFGGDTKSNDGDVTGNHGNGDAWLVKIDLYGDIQWQNAMGGSFYDGINAVRQTTNGDYVVAGIASSHDGDVLGNNGGADYWVAKVDVNGNLLWNNCLGGSQSDFAYDINPAQDGGYFVVGFSQSNDGDVSSNKGGRDIWLVKIDDSGNPSWDLSIGGSAEDHGRSVRIGDDGNLVIAGLTNSVDGDIMDNKGGYDFCLVTIGCSTTTTCPADIIVNSEPGICGAIVNYAPPTITGSCSSSNVLLTGGFESGQEFPVGTTTVSFLITDVIGSTSSCSFKVTVEGLIAFAGSDQVVIIDSGPGPDPYPCDTLEGTASGGTGPYTYSWSPTEGLSDPNAATTDVCPTVTTTYTLTVTDANGCESTDEVTVTVIDIDDTGTLPLVGNNSNKVYVCHLATCETVEANIQANCNSPNSLCAHLAHGDELGECTCKNGSGEGDPHVHDLIPQLNAYPNPFTNTTTLTFTVEHDCQATLSVFDITGKEVAQLFDGAAIKGKLHVATLDGSNLGSGIYFYTLQTDYGKSFTRKLVLSR